MHLNKHYKLIWLSTSNKIVKIIKLLWFQIAFNSVAYDAGLKNRDYIYEVNGVSVLEMDHDQCTKLIKDAGDSIDLKIERYCQ